MSKIEQRDGKIVIENLEIKDEETLEYLSEKEDIENKIRTALKLGVLSLRSGETTQNVDYVQKRFNKLENTLDDQIGELQDEFEEKVSNKLGENGDLVDEFNPNEPGTPLHDLRTNLEDKIQQLRTDLEVEEAEEEMKEDTHLKGHEFEDQLEILLGNIVQRTGDELEFTGDETGKVADSKKGDFLIKLQNSDLRIAVEAKNAKYSKPKIKEEMEGVLENRDADYGIFFSKQKEAIPQSLGWFTEIEGNYLIVPLTEDQQDLEDGSLELVNIAYKWAKIRAKSKASVDEETTDLSEISQKLEAMSSELGKFSQIKGKASKIRKRANEIDELSEKIKTDVEEEIEEIDDNLP